MPLIDITKPEVINFFIETYEKTDRLRMRWNNLNAAKLKQAATLQREEKGYRDIDVFKATIEEGILSVSRDNKSDARNRRLKPIRDGLHIPRLDDMQKGHSIVDVGLGDPKKDPRLARPNTDLTIDPIMRPVDPSHKKILYKDKPEYGRKVYLKKRCGTARPEDRYYFAETSGWFYGWRLSDCFYTKSAPKHGRVWHLAREACRSGPQPDPIHYKLVGLEETKCST